MDLVIAKTTNRARLFARPYQSRDTSSRGCASFEHSTHPVGKQDSWIQTRTKDNLQRLADDNDISRANLADVASK